MLIPLSTANHTSDTKMTSHFLPRPVLAGLKFLGRFPLKQSSNNAGGWLEKVSISGLLLSLSLLSLCILGNQHIYLLVRSVFSAPPDSIPANTKIALIVLMIHQLSSYTLYLAWFFALPGLIASSQKLATFDDTYWSLIGKGTTSHFAMLRNVTFWILLTCSIFIAVLMGKAQWTLAAIVTWQSDLWLKSVSSNNEDVVMYTIASVGVYGEAVNSATILILYVIGHALNRRIRLLTLFIENEGQALLTMKAIKVALHGSKVPRTDETTGIWIVRDMVVKLLDIHKDFSSASEFMLLVKITVSTVLTCFSVFHAYEKLSIYRLLTWQEEIEGAYMFMLLTVTVINLFMLANCGEVLSRNVSSSCLNNFK